MIKPEDRETEQDALELAVQSFAEHICNHDIKVVEWTNRGGAVELRVTAYAKEKDGEPKAEGE